MVKLLPKKPTVLHKVNYFRNGTNDLFFMNMPSLSSTEVYMDYQKYFLDMYYIYLVKHRGIYFALVPKINVVTIQISPLLIVPK